MGILNTLIVGLIAGVLASWIMHARGGLIIDLILGVVGGFVGGWLTGLLLGRNMMTGFNLPSILVALGGAIVFLLVYRLLFRRR
jgi:uncharacterized membrane protein YeaQ/YmgE (transglycosylase-associated protein family)